MAVRVEALRANNKESFFKLPEPERKALRSALIGGIAGLLLGALAGVPGIGVGLGAAIAGGKTWHDYRFGNRRS